MAKLKESKALPVALVQYKTAGNTVLLTHKQAEVLAMIEQGMTDKQIGKQLCRSPGTIAERITVLKAKLKCNTRVELGLVSYKYRVQKAIEFLK